MQENLGDLIESARHSGGEKSLSYAELSKQCGGKPTAARLQQYVAGSLKNFPDPESIRNLSKGTRRTTKEIILASATSLGLHTEPDAEDLIFINGISTLPPSAAESLKSIGREMVNLSSKADHAEAPGPHTTTQRQQLRAVAPIDHPGKGQKTGPEGFSITEIHGAETAKYPAPPLEQLAAHPYFETEQEKFDRHFGERGEENQDPEDADHP